MIKDSLSLSEQELVFSDSTNISTFFTLFRGERPAQSLEQRRLHVINTGGAAPVPQKLYIVSNSERTLINEEVRHATARRNPRVLQSMGSSRYLRKEKKGNVAILR